MLKRYQVLLPDWMQDYIQFIADKYDLSFSETIRGEICVAILCITSHLYPDYKSGLSTKEFLDQIKKIADEKMTKEKMHKVISQVSHEARKYVEYRLSKEKIQKQ